MPRVAAAGRVAGAHRRTRAVPARWSPGRPTPRHTAERRMRLLVAGGAGFIGSHLCERLLDRGDEVVCVDNLLTGSLGNVAHLRDRTGFSIIEHDVTRPLDVAADAIFHLASPASPVA